MNKKDVAKYKTVGGAIALVVAIGALVATTNNKREPNENYFNAPTPVVEDKVEAQVESADLSHESYELPPMVAPQIQEEVADLSHEPYTLPDIATIDAEPYDLPEILPVLLEEDLPPLES